MKPETSKKKLFVKLFHMNFFFRTYAAYINPSSFFLYPLPLLRKQNAELKNFYRVLFRAEKVEKIFLFFFF